MTEITSSTGISNYKNWLDAESQPKKKYVVTGTDNNGKRFEPIHTNTPQFYNICNGTVWKIVDGKRKLVYRVFN